MQRDPGKGKTNTGVSDLLALVFLLVNLVDIHRRARAQDALYKGGQAGGQPVASRSKGAVCKDAQPRHDDPDQAKDRGNEFVRYGLGVL